MGANGWTYVAAGVVSVLLLVAGIYGNAPVAGFLAAVAVAGLLVVNFHATFNPGGPLPLPLQRAQRLIRTASLVVLIPAAVFLLFGIWNPAGSKELDTTSKNVKRASTNSLKKQNRKLETGSFGVMKASGGIYDRYGNHHTYNGKILTIEEGEMVMAVDFEGVPADMVHEGLTRVITTNRLGDFVKKDKYVFYVSSEKIDWDTEIRR